MCKQPSKAFHFNKRFSKKDKIYEKVKLGPSNFEKMQTTSQYPWSKILIYRSLYFFKFMNSYF